MTHSFYLFYLLLDALCQTVLRSGNRNAPVEGQPLRSQIQMKELGDEKQVLLDKYVFGVICTAALGFDMMNKGQV